MVKLLIILHIFWGNPFKGFKEAANRNYPAAIQIFRSSTETTLDKTMSYYGLALIYSNMQYRGYNYDTAYYYTNLCELHFRKLDDQEKEKAGKLNISLLECAKLKKDIAFEALTEIDRRDIKRLERFVLFYGDEKIADKVKTMLDERKFFIGKIKDTTDLGFYMNIIKRYPQNPRINEVWYKYYNLYTLDGKTVAFLKFSREHPNFPLDTLLRYDWNVARMCDKAKLLEGVSKLNEAEYVKYIKKAAPRNQAFEALQVYLKKDIEAKNWEKVKAISLQFKDDFDGNKMYANFLKVLEREDKIVVPKKLSSNINSQSGHEYSPVISADGEHLYFAGMSRGDNIGGEDIYLSEMKNGVWQPAKPIDAINTKDGNEAPEALSVDETVIILYYNGNILWSQQIPGGWSDPKLVKGINTEKWEGDAVLSSDGNAIVFASAGWSKEGIQFEKRFPKDEFDLYVSVKTGRDTWSKPINLGTTINTPYCDRYPYLHPDMKTLYFSSQGHGGLGNNDVYRSVRLSDTSWTLWSEPENLGKYINTTDNDNGYKITTDGSKAYFSIKDGDIDLYTIDLPNELKPEFVALVKGTITDDHGNFLEAKIELENLETGGSLGTFFSSPVTGNYVMILPLGKNYGYFVSKEGYFPSSDNLDLRNKNEQIEVRKDFQLHSIKDLVASKTYITIKNIFFEVDKAVLQSQSHSELQRLLDILKEYPNLSIEIAGHTDNTGTDAHNMDLSDRRASAVKQYLKNNGCSESRLFTKGFGATKPIADNASDEGKALNRRVEILFK